MIILDPHTNILQLLCQHSKKYMYNVMYIAHPGSASCATPVHKFFFNIFNPLRMRSVVTVVSVSVCVCVCVTTLAATAFVRSPKR